MINQDFNKYFKVTGVFQDFYLYCWSQHVKSGKTESWLFLLLTLENWQNCIRRKHRCEQQFQVWHNHNKKRRKILTPLCQDVKVSLTAQNAAWTILRWNAEPDINEQLHRSGWTPASQWWCYWWLIKISKLQMFDYRRVLVHLTRNRQWCLRKKIPCNWDY